MCVTEIYRDRYPDGQEFQFRQLKTCQYGRAGRPCETHRTLEMAVRQIQFGEATSESLLTRLHTPPRSTHRPESIVEIVDESDRSDRRRKKKRSSLLMSTFFGQSPSNSPHRRRSQRARRIVIESSPPPSIRAPRTPPLGIYTEQRAPMTPPPFIRNASPTRGRRSEPVVIINGRGARATSTEVQIGSRHPSRHRSPSPRTYRARQRQEQIEAEAARLRRREEEEARLESEIREVRRARLREQEYAEINSRPAVPMPPPRPRYRTVVEQSDRLHEVMGGLSLGTTGDRIVAEAIEEGRWRERMVRAGRDAEAAERRDAAERRERLSRRFTVGGGSSRRHRVLYDDGTYRYEASV